MTNAHEDDDDCTCEPTEGFYMVEPPSWKFSVWDVAGITLHTVSGVLVAVANGFGLMARECQASANRARKTWDLRQAERLQAEHAAEMSAAAEKLLGLPTTEDRS